MGAGGGDFFKKTGLFLKKASFLANIECCPKFLEYALLILSIMKRAENLQLCQSNSSQVIKVKSVQSFRDVFRTQWKILAFVYSIAKKLHCTCSTRSEYPHLWGWWWRRQSYINHLVPVLWSLAVNKFCTLVFMHI